MFITISGPIGVGKSTVTSILAAIMNFDPFFETVEGHPYLEGLYRSPKDYAFKTQVFFLRDRFEKHMNSVKRNVNIVADRSIYEDVVFAEVLFKQGHMEPDDYYRVYLPHFQLLSSILPPPDLMIYLRADIDTLLYRIASRGRNMEKSISREYMEMLSKRYEQWIVDYPYKKLVVDTGNLDLTCDLNPDWSYFIQAIYDTINGKTQIDYTLQLSDLKTSVPSQPGKSAIP